MSNVNETLDLVRKAHGNPQTADAITKAFQQSTGLVSYDLEAPAAKIVPVITPLRNMCPRVKSNAGDTATRWKAITAINTGNTHPGVTEGNRGAIISDSVADYTATYVGIGLENSVTFEADYAAESFDDAKARAVENLLYASILKEEDMLLGGNASLALGTTPTPTVSNAGTGGTIAAGTYNVICVALTYDAFRRTTVSATGIPFSATPGTPGVIRRTNADGTTDDINVGAAQKSVAGSTTTLGTTSTISATVDAVKGAVGYAWYVGVADSEKIAAVTTSNSVTITALPAAGNQTAAAGGPATDRSRQNGYSFDGFLYTALGCATSYYSALGAKLAADGKGGVNQINDVLGWYWDTLQLQPDAIWCNRQQVNDITSLCVGNATSPFRFNVNGGVAQGSLVGGGKVTEYQSPVDSSIIPINIHPKMPAGTVMFTTKRLPYALNNVPEVFRIKARREWYQIEWPLRTRKYEYGVYADEVFQHYFPASLGVLTNITAGV